MGMVMSSHPVLIGKTGRVSGRVFGKIRKLAGVVERLQRLSPHIDPPIGSVSIEQAVLLLYQSYYYSLEDAMTPNLSMLLAVITGGPRDHIIDEVSFEKDCSDRESCRINSGAAIVIPPVLKIVALDIGPEICSSSGICSLQVR
eukprot:scaffold241_cov89-Cylindrotheca_fusiformis.AAC.8